MRITTRRSSVGIPHLFCPVEEGSNPEGDRDPPNVPRTPFMRERGRVGRNGRGTECTRERERERGQEKETGRERERGQERERGREWERDPQSKSRGLTGAEGGWWARVHQGVWEAMAAKSSLMVKQRGAIAPPEHGRDTSLRVGKPEHDGGSENAAHVRVLGVSRHGYVGGQCTHGVVLKRYAPRYTNDLLKRYAPRYSNDLLKCPATKTFGATLRRLCATKGAFAPPKFGYDTSSRAKEQEQDRGSMSTTSRARVRD